MNSLLLRADDILRQRRWSNDNRRVVTTAAWMALIIMICGAVYGSVMGAFGGFATDRILQVLFSAIKVPLLLLATFALSLPSFYVFNVLFGLGSDFRPAVRSLAATQATIAIILAAMAPYTAVWYASCATYNSAILFNALMFSVASLSGQLMLQNYYRQLVRRNRKHRWMMWVWMATYSAVGIQMGWVLRPFVGSAGMDPQFLREGEITNAYVVVFRLIWRTIWG